MNIFKYHDYKKLIEDIIEQNRESRGYRSRLAEAAECQKSFFSLVINSSVHLTPEHTVNLCTFWSFNRQQTEYFIELVNLARCGNPRLRRYLEGRLESLRKEREDLNKRYPGKSVIADKHALTYYSSWHFSAIHILTTISGYQTVKAIATRLQMAEHAVGECLESLKEMGLVLNRGGKWESTDTVVHLPKGSPLNSVNHNNWRQRAVLDSTDKGSIGVHYTSIGSISSEDSEYLKEMILKFIDDSRKIIVPSKEEKLVCINCDFFEA